MLNIVHLIDKKLVSSINKEIVWDASASVEALPLLMEEYNKNPVVMGYHTWKSIGEKKLGKQKNYVVSRKKRKLQRGVKQIIDPISVKEKLTIIGGSTLILSISPKDIKEIILVQLKIDSITEYSKPIEEFTTFPDYLYEKTKIVEDTPLYSIRMWKNYVDN